jgi:sensor histidine kinase regulating citrate/malate metabolism
LSNYLGDTAATAIQTTLTIVVNLIIAYVVVLQFFKILKGIENKNSADGAERTQAMATIKNAIIVIVLVTTVGAVGFNALL